MTEVNINMLDEVKTRGIRTEEKLKMLERQQTESDKRLLDEVRRSEERVMKHVDAVGNEVKATISITSDIAGAVAELKVQVSNFMDLNGKRTVLEELSRPNVYIISIIIGVMTFFSKIPLPTF